MKKILKKIFPKKFGAYWNKIRLHENIDEDLRFISDKFIKSESYNYVSNQWHLWNISDYKTIINNEPENYATEIFSHYFTFVDYQDEYLERLFDDINNLEEKKINSNLFKKHETFNYKYSVLYNYLCLLLHENLKKTEYYEYLSKLNDKSFLGFKDPFITIDGVNITTDKIVSLFDLEKIDKFSKIREKDRILEIGAGSGRLSDCIMSIKKNICYTICDIPPSIYICYKRLKLAFPEKKIKLLVDCDNSRDLNQNINDNDITFIFPHQLKNINSEFYNLTIAVDCLHEMNQSTLRDYFNMITRISDKMYFSIWNKTKNWHSESLFKRTERLNFEKGDYPIPKSWKIAFKENLKFPSNHLSIGYDIQKKLK